MPKNQRCWPRAVGDCGTIDGWVPWVPPCGAGGLGRTARATIITRRDFVKEMSPRKYDMSKRASAVAQTRRRIVDATRELHTERGIAATSWDDIAARAGVGVGTVYRHFPSLDELVPACGEVSMQVVAPPDPEDAPSLFDGADGPAERIERLVREAFAIYERGAPELRVIRNEPDVHPSVAEAGEEFEASLAALVDAAGIAPADRAVVRAMVDLGTWQALRDQGLGPAEAVDVVSRMLAAWTLEQLGDPCGRDRGAVGLDGPVVDVAPDLLGDRLGDRPRASRSRSPCAARRRSARAGGARGCSARSGGAAGSRGTGGGWRSAPSRWSALPARRRGRRRRGGGRGRGRTRGPRGRRAPRSDAGSMRGPATTIMRSSGTRCLASGKAAMTRSSSERPTPDPPTVTMHTCSAGP